MSKSEKNKQKSKKNKQNYLFSYMTDVALSILLIAFVLLDILSFKVKIIDYGNNIKELSVVTVTLMPCVLTIVSISLSISKEKIYGVFLNDFNGLRGDFYFTFFHMILITCVIFGAYSLLSAFDLRIAIYFLELISLIYSFIFSIQEVPILVRSKKKIKKILNKNYLKISRNGLLFEKENTNTFNIIITNIILTEGISTAYNVLYKKGIDKQDLLDYLLTMQNKYFWNIRENLSIEKSSPLDIYYDVPIIDAIDKGYENITAFISKAPTTYLDTKLEKNKYYQITRSIYSLHDLCCSLGIENKEKKEMTSIITYSDILSFSNKNITISISSIICMLATTLDNGEVWFIKLLRDNDWYPSAIFDFETCPVGIFVCMMINHLLEKNVLNTEATNEIKKFIEEQVQGINADGSTWKKLMKKSIEFGKAEYVANSIIKFLKYYNSVDESVFYFHGTQKKVVYDRKDEFTKQSLFHDWLLLILAIGYNSIDLNPIFDKLNDEEKKILAEELSDNWIECGTIKETINDSSFLNLFEIYYYSCPNNSLTTDVKEQLIKFHDTYYKNKCDASSCGTRSLKDSYKKIIDKTKKAIQSNHFYKETLSVEKEPKKYFGFTIRARDYEQILDVHLEQLPWSFMEMINESVKKVTGFNKNHGKPTITNNTIKEIIDFAPKFQSPSYLINTYLINNKNEYEEKIKQLNLETVTGLEPNLFWKDDAIQFNAIVDETFTLIRTFNKDELEKVIEDEYKPYDNGLYRYSEIKNDIKHDFYVTKDELMKYLSKSLFYVCIVFKCSVSIDKSKIKSIYDIEQ